MTALTLAEIADKPERFTFWLQLGEGFVIRPLLRNDIDGLTAFFAGLSPETRQFSSYDQADYERAQEHCQAIAKYDKLRFVLCASTTIVGLFELSFSVTPNDIERFKGYGEALNPSACVRYGLCLADAIQNQRIARSVFPYIVDLIRRFDHSHIMLWGGVHTDNLRAIRHYQALGFRRIGHFINSDGTACLDMTLTLI